MSEIKHAYRLMVIDIEKDQVVLDEFCDCIVGGVGKKSRRRGKDRRCGRGYTELLGTYRCGCG